MLSITGIALNHTDGLQLSKISISHPWLLKLYGVSRPELVSYNVDGRWYTQAGEQFFVNDLPIDVCTGELIGAMDVPPFSVLACSDELALLDEEHQLLERIGSFHGIPTPITKLGRCSEGICVQNADRAYQVNLDDLSVISLDGKFTSELVWSNASAELPAEVARAISVQGHGGHLNGERLMLDLHAGRFFGALGPFFMDFIALVFIFVAGSGAYMWLKSGTKRKRNSD